jgi:hypothetical protein
MKEVFSACTYSVLTLCEEYGFGGSWNEGLSLEIHFHSLRTDRQTDTIREQISVGRETEMRVGKRNKKG